MSETPTYDQPTQDFAARQGAITEVVEASLAGEQPAIQAPEIVTDQERINRIFSNAFQIEQSRLSVINVDPRNINLN